MQDVPGPRGQRRTWHGFGGQACLEPVDPVRLHRVLLPSVGVERDRLPRPGLPARLPQPRHQRRARNGRSPTTDDVDPVPFAQRVERARQPTTTCRAVGPVSDYRTIRARNESAWLIPNDGSRTNHRLRADMRRYDDDDEVDVVIVGAGAGGGVLTQRLARAGWRVVVPGRRTVLGPGHRLGQRRTRLPQAVLDRAAADRRRRPGPAGLQQLRPRRRRIDGALRRLHAAVSPVGLPHPQRRRRGRRLADRLPRPRPYYEQIEAELPVAGQDWPWGDPHRYPHSPHPVGGNGQIVLRGARQLGIEMRVGPVAIPNGRFGNRPHCIYRGFCLQGCKVNAKASPLITHIPDALAHGAEIRPDSHVSAVARRRRHRRAPPASTLPAPASRTGNGPARSSSPATRIETPRLLLLSATDRYPRRPGQRPRPGRPLPDGAGRTPDRRPVRRRDPHVQGAAARGQQRTVLRNRPDQALPARLVHPDRQPAADHLGRTRHRARTLGHDAARVHARLRALGHPRRAVRIPAPTRQPRHPGRRERPPRPAGRALRLQPSATTTSS